MGFNNVGANAQVVNWTGNVGSFTSAGVANLRSYLADKANAVAQVIFSRTGLVVIVAIVVVVYYLPTIIHMIKLAIDKIQKTNTEIPVPKKSKDHVQDDFKISLHTQESLETLKEKNPAKYDEVLDYFILLIQVKNESKIKDPAICELFLSHLLQRINWSKQDSLIDVMNFVRVAEHIKNISSDKFQEVMKTCFPLYPLIVPRDKYDRISGLLFRLIKQIDPVFQKTPQEFNKSFHKNFFKFCYQDHFFKSSYQDHPMRLVLESLKKEDHDFLLSSEAITTFQMSFFMLSLGEMDGVLYCLKNADYGFFLDFLSLKTTTHHPKGPWILLNALLEDISTTPYSTKSKLFSTLLKTLLMACPKEFKEFNRINPCCLSDLVRNGTEEFANEVKEYYIDYFKEGEFLKKIDVKPEVSGSLSNLEILLAFLEGDEKQLTNNLKVLTYLTSANNASGQSFFQHATSLNFQDFIKLWSNNKPLAKKILWQPIENTRHQYHYGYVKIAYPNVVQYMVMQGQDEEEITEFLKGMYEEEPEFFKKCCLDDRGAQALIELDCLKSDSQLMGIVGGDAYHDIVMEGVGIADREIICERICSKDFKKLPNFFKYSKSSCLYLDPMKGKEYTQILSKEFNFSEVIEVSVVGPMEKTTWVTGPLKEMTPLLFERFPNLKTLIIEAEYFYQWKDILNSILDKEICIRFSEFLPIKYDGKSRPDQHTFTWASIYDRFNLRSTLYDKFSPQQQMKWFKMASEGALTIDQDTRDDIKDFLKQWNVLGICKYKDPVEKKKDGLSEEQLLYDMEIALSVRNDYLKKFVNQKNFKVDLIFEVEAHPEFKHEKFKKIVLTYFLNGHMDFEKEDVPSLLQFANYISDLEMNRMIRKKCHELGIILDLPQHSLETTERFVESSENRIGSI